MLEQAAQEMGMHKVASLQGRRERLKAQLQEEHTNLDRELNRVGLAISRRS